MSVFEALRNAFYSLLAHKLRSGLTILGILIGVATVASMMSVTGGINEFMAKELDMMAPKVFYIWKMPPMTISMDWRKYESRPDITVEEVEYLKRNSKTATFITPSAAALGIKVKYKDRETNPMTYVGGTDHTMPFTYAWPMAEGRFMSAAEVRHKKHVCVLGADVAEKLFPHESALNKEVSAGGHRFRVIGVLSKKGGIMGESQDSMVIIPVGVFKKYFREDWSLEVLVRVKPNVPMDEGIDEIRYLLRTKRGLKGYEDDNFAIETRETFMKAYENLTGAAFAAAIGIAAISLIVGGIGIMNIMLVSVRERTREIGIRKSVGASRRDIFTQFLIESIMMSLVGGVLGLAIAIWGLSIAQSKVPSLPMKMFGWHLILAFGFSVVAGVVFGIIPARRASSLNPIECLRYE